MIISRTPLRISFAGGGTDLRDYYVDNDGFVVSTAINKYVYITVNKKFDDQIRLSYSTTEIVNNVDDIKHNIIREALKITGIDKGIEIVYMADIPLGSAGVGLGSSSALAVGVLKALHAFKGNHVTFEKLASEACQIEIEILKNPIGKQDQYIVAYGGFQAIQFNRDDSVFIDHLVLNRSLKDKLNQNLLMFYTGTTRFSTPILAEQNNRTEVNLEHLNGIKTLARRLQTELETSNVDSVGEILHEGWCLKRKLASGISNEEIDRNYEKARRAGAVGGKILGAGGGGFLLMYCRKEYQKRVISALEDYRLCPFKFEAQGSKILYISDCDHSI